MWEYKTRTIGRRIVARNESIIDWGRESGACPVATTAEQFRVASLSSSGIHDDHNEPESAQAGVVAVLPITTF